MTRNAFLFGISLLCQSTTSGQVIPFGLQGKAVNSIRLVDDVLYAGTTGGGVFMRGLSDTGWTSLGLEGKDIRSVYPHRDDGSGFSMLAGVYANHSLGDSTVIYGLSSSGWAPADSGVDHVRTYEISSINGMFTPSGDHIVYATGYDWRLYKRSGLLWNNVFTQSCRVVEISPSGDLWAGGALFGFVIPFAARSTNQGTTWSWTSFDSIFDNTMISLAFDLFDPNVVYASALTGVIFKTTNGGTGWNVTEVPVFRPRLALDPFLPNHLFCGGTDDLTNGRLMETVDGGSTWQEMALPESMKNIWDLKIGIADSLDLYLATEGSGVYRLRQYTPAFGLNVASGWNMISIPKHVPDYRKFSLFPQSMSAAFGYEGSYRVQDTLENGKGYWMKFSSAEMLSVTSDLSIVTDTIEVRAGWNMIGSISRPVSTAEITSDPPGIVTSQFYTYHAAYVTSANIMPGSAYWVKVNQSGRFILSSAGTAASPLRKIVIRLSNEVPPPSPDGNVSSAEPQIPNLFILAQNYPNPFNPTTTIEYQLAAPGHVRLSIFNVLGEEIARLTDRDHPAGYYNAEWDAGAAPSGIYYARMTIMDRLRQEVYQSTRKLLLMR